MPAHALRALPTGKPQTKHDGLLHLAKNFNKPPDVLIGDGNSILGTGMPGSGKTTVMALLLEQFGACGIPFAAFDLEGDLKSVVDLLPRGVLATPDNCPGAEDMYKYGLQVVFDLEAWGDDRDRAARLITRTVNGLLSHMKALPSHLRVPFLVGLDEAAYWLPQVRKGCDHLSAAMLSELFATFHPLAVRGRKMGLIPMLFTQRLADVHKDVIAPGTYILMRQTTDVDLKRYMEYVDGSAFGEDEEDLTRLQMRQRIAAFRPGQAILKLPSGRSGTIQFHNRASVHTSHAPKSMAATNLYRDVPFDKSMRYGTDRDAPSTERTDQAPPTPATLRVLPTGGRSPLRAQVFALLEKNPGLNTTDLVLATGCSPSGVGKYLAEYFALYPGRRPEANTLRSRIFALLERDPSLSNKELAKLAGAAGGGDSAQQYRAEYFDLHPDRRVEVPTIKEQVFALLERDPQLTNKELAQTLGHPLSTMSKCRADYFARYPERSVKVPTVKEQVFAALEKDPTTPNKELSSMTRAPLSNVRTYRADYFALYPERQQDPPPALMAQIFALLEKDPTLKGAELANLANCPTDRAATYRHKYFTSHPERRPKE
jgi:hypothetical protein